MEYEVLDRVVHEEHAYEGVRRASFAKGVVKADDLSEDERFILEHRLIPAGLARRVAPAKKES